MTAALAFEAAANGIRLGKSRVALAGAYCVVERGLQCVAEISTELGSHMRSAIINP